MSVLDKPAGPLFREHTEPIRRMLHAALLEIFWKLIVAWVIGPGRHPITRLYSIAEPDGRRAHDTYHRFLRLGAWSLERLWRTLALLVVAPSARMDSWSWRSMTRSSRSGGAR